jgi:NAD(P)-dependent dehydrogenase (short-subunit alcohol dehydrogenase family)
MNSLLIRYRGELSCLGVRRRTSFPQFTVNRPHRYPFDRAKKLFDINVHGAYLTAREAAKIMIPNGGGSIILIASMSASASLIRSLNGMVLCDRLLSRSSTSHK